MHSLPILIRHAFGEIHRTCAERARGMETCVKHEGLLGETQSSYPGPGLKTEQYCSLPPFCLRNWRVERSGRRHDATLLEVRSAAPGVRHASKKLRLTRCGILSSLWNPGFNARVAASGTQLRWTSPPDGGKVMSKTARFAASRICCALSMTPPRRNSLSQRNWSEKTGLGGCPHTNIFAFGRIPTAQLRPRYSYWRQGKDQWQWRLATALAGWWRTTW